MRAVIGSVGQTKTEGIAAAISSLSDSLCVMWDKNRKPVFDMMFEIQPDILFISMSDMTDDTVAALKKYPDTKIVILDNELTKSMAELPNEKVLCTKAELSEPQKQLLSDWNIKFIHLKDCANICQYNRIRPQESDEYDICYFSNKTLDLYEQLSLQKLLYPNSTYRVILVGKSPLPVVEYLGGVRISEYMGLMSKAKINICMDEHYYDIAANNSFALCSKPNKFFPNFTSSNIKDMVDYYIENEDKRMEYANKAYQLIKEDKDTSLDRLNDILDTFEITTYKEEIESLKGRIL